MKIKCEVELDWVNEDYSIDDAIQSKLSRLIAEQLSSKCSGITERAKEVLEKEIKEFTKQILTEFMEGTITTTDRYGDIKRENITVRDLIKEEFDKSLNMIVDKNGNPSSYSGSYPLIKWLTGEAVKKEISSEFKDFSRRSCR